MLSRLSLVTLSVILSTAAPRPPSTQDAPFIETFRHGGRTVIYVAATHHSSVLYPDPVRDPVFRTIESVFSTSPPDAVIVEGVDPSQMNGFLNYARQCGEARYNLAGTPCDEAAFTAWYAEKNGASVYGGEPPASAELAAFKARGYSAEDFLAFWIMNNIPPEKRHGQLTEEKFRQLVERVVRGENYALGTSLRFTTEDFAAWYARNMHVPRSYMDIRNEDTSPFGSNTVLHRMAALSNIARDGNVVKIIRDILNNHERVLVVYGASHLDFEWSDLVRFMGVPKKTKPF